ncbi:TATA-box binding protein [Neomoorella glycerini]|uniref:TATA-box binding protein n=1 Tax=Neomoorella glycerini TaxID=55779 RepID=A0A6I5ZQ81_9FIRM|nr:YwmB family TATA-box binding protein [Moorella glycerini]QGP91757.1 TATA-box binding protein [Moorella glycerini]
MRRFSFNFLRFNFKIFLLIVLLLSFTGGLALARHLHPLAARTSRAASIQAASTVQAVDRDDPVPHLLFNALTAGGARLETMGLEAWGSLNSTFMDGEAIQDLAGRAATALGLEGITSFTRQDDAGFHALFWEGELQPGVVLYFSLQSLAGAGEGGETYLLINLEGQPKQGEGEMLAWQEKVREAFRPWQVEPHLIYNLTGVIPGKLTPAEREQRARAVLAALAAEKVEGVEDEELLSISAYTPRLPRSLEVAGRPVNANVALRYHATDDNTYLHLGSPLLGGEY